VSNNIVFKNVLKVLMCVGVFTMLFITTAFASGSFSSTYHIESPCCRPGNLIGRTHFDISGSNRTVTITLSNSTHNAGWVDVFLQRRGPLGGWSAATNSVAIPANRSGSIGSVNSGTYRLFMTNQFNGATGSGQPLGTAVNSGNVRVSWN
jgi:hypothetical protein